MNQATDSSFVRLLAPSLAPTRGADATPLAHLLHPSSFILHPSLPIIPTSTAVPRRGTTAGKSSTDWHQGASMAEEKVEAREPSWSHLLPWTTLFRGFQITLDLNKLLLASAGIVLTAFVWWLLSIIFAAGEKNLAPDWPGDGYGVNEPGWTAFR